MVQTAAKLGLLIYLKPPPVPLINTYLGHRKAILKIMYGKLQFKEREMAAKADKEEMEEMTSMGQSTSQPAINMQ